MIGVLAVGVAMIEESERVVESFLVRVSRRPRLTESPLANHRGAIAGVAQAHGHRDLAFPKGEFAVAADESMARVHSGHQRGARRRADSAARVVLREADAVLREA